MIQFIKKFFRPFYNFFTKPPSFTCCEMEGFNCNQGQNCPYRKDAFVIRKRDIR